MTQHAGPPVDSGSGPQGGYPQPGPPQKKPSKPFYKRWYVWVGVIVVIGIIASAAGGKKKDKVDGSAPVKSGAVVAPSSASAAASSANSAAASTSKSSGISKGLGTKDASGDVKISSKVGYSEDSGTQLTLTVTNHSSKRSDYIIDVALETADGSQQLDDSPALAENLDPGQSTKVEVDFLNYISKAPPASAVVKLKSIQRNPSL